MAKKKTAPQKTTSSKAKAAGKVSPKKKPTSPGRTVAVKSASSGKTGPKAGKGSTNGKALAKGASAKKGVKGSVKPVKKATVGGSKASRTAPVSKVAPKAKGTKAKPANGPTKPAEKKTLAKGTKKGAVKGGKPVAKAPPKKAAPPVRKTGAPLVKKAASAKLAPASASAKKVEKTSPSKTVDVRSSKAAPNEKVAVPSQAPMVPPSLIDKPDKASPKAAEASKRPLKERVQIEFMVRSAPAVLFDLISTPSGFSEWYCSDVNMKGDQYTFIWPDEVEETTMIGRRLGEVIRFHRNDEEDENAYFEFRIRIDAMTNEVALIVTDHAWPDEVEETRNLWSSQIASLIRVLGA